MSTYAAARPTAKGPADLVVVIPCGAAKLPHEAPAGDLYTGNYHRACRSTADALTACGGTVLILSDLYGLMPLHRVIAPYDVRLGEPGSVSVEQLREQARILGLDRAREVIVLAGASYVTATRQVWPQATAPLAGIGGLGHQMQWLRELRDEAAAELSNG